MGPRLNEIKLTKLAGHAAIAPWGLRGQLWLASAKRSRSPIRRWALTGTRRWPSPAYPKQRGAPDDQGNSLTQQTRLRSDPPQYLSGRRRSCSLVRGGGMDIVRPPE